MRFAFEKYESTWVHFSNAPITFESTMTMNSQIMMSLIGSHLNENAVFAMKNLHTMKIVTIFAT